MITTHIAAVTLSDGSLVFDVYLTEIGADTAAIRLNAHTYNDALALERKLRRAIAAHSLADLSSDSAEADAKADAHCRAAGKRAAAAITGHTPG